MVERAPQPEVQFAAMEQQERNNQEGFQKIINFIDGWRERILGK